MPGALLDSLVLDCTAATPLQQQLCLGLKRLIERGTLPAGRSVPSSRALAEDLRVSRNTVLAAYDRLVSEGYLDARPRSGLFVSESLAAVPRGRNPRRAVRPSREPGGASYMLPGPRPFRPCRPDVRLFPLATWNRLRARRLRADGIGLLGYQSQFAMGLPELRQALAGYLRESRGVHCDWRQMAITSGSQQALYLLGQLLLEPGSQVVMEDPGYTGARQAWLQRGAILRPAAVDDHGLVGPDALGLVDPVLIYCTPSRQFPTGACLPLSRRLAWLEFARRKSAWVVEDDYDSEFRYGRQPVPSLHSLDTTGRVVYVGSMSKVLFPSLRIGYVVLPATFVDRFAALRTVMDDHGPLIDQAVLAAFIDTGAFYTHIRRCRRRYGERQRAFLDAARRNGLPLTFAHTDGGMNLLGMLPAGTDDEHLSRRLQKSGFDVPALRSYGLGRPRPGLVFGYTAFDPNTLRRQVARLARLMVGPR
ncbi:MAG TPA: PLP-dependent aminotransferase family protein [Vicinamibacterales bacterium]|nr:PLP-dependent aminotransferase family protein [Vicinamibacterales bacterium]